MTVTLDFVTNDEATTRREHRENGRTVYARLLARGYTREQIEKAIEDADGYMRRIYLTGHEQPGSDEIVIGVQYTGDFRAEEEWGLAAIAKMLNNPNVDQTDVTGVFTYEDRPYFVIAGERTYGGIDAIAQNIIEAHERALTPRLYDDYFADERKSVAELRAELKGIVTPLPRKRADLLSAYRTHLRGIPARQSVGEFHHGDWLVMAPEGDLLTDALALIFEATEANSLRFGGSKNPFSRAAMFYDERDLTPETINVIREAQHYHDTQMEAIADVKAQLKAKGSLYAIRPERSSRNSDTVRDCFLINYYPRYSKAVKPNEGVWGWFTREELLNGLETDWEGYER